MKHRLSGIKQSPRLRFVRTIRSVLTPVSKSGVKTRTLGYLRQIFRSKEDSLLFASYPSSGWNWTVDVLSCALSHHFLNRYDVTYGSASRLKLAEQKPFRLSCPADARAQFIPSLKTSMPAIKVDYCYHTHGFYGEAPLFGLQRSKTVIVTRDFATAMFSGYAKRRGEYRSVEEYIRRSNGLERIARFYNSWHAFQQEHPSRTLIVSYEQMRKAPKDTFARLLEFGFDENVSDAILDEALEFYSFESQKARERQFSSDENSHFHYKGKTSYRDEMGEETHEWIQRELRSRIPSFETWQALTKVPVRDGL